MEPLALLLVAVLVWGVFGWFGAYIAEQKGRGSFEGFIFGFVLGPFGCLIEVLLPTQHRSPTYRRYFSGAGVTVPEMPEDWGRPGTPKPVPDVPDDGVDMNWLKGP